MSTRTTTRKCTRIVNESLKRLKTAPENRGCFLFLYDLKKLVYRTQQIRFSYFLSDFESDEAFTPALSLLAEELW